MLCVNMHEFPQVFLSLERSTSAVMNPKWFNHELVKNSTFWEQAMQ